MKLTHIVRQLTQQKDRAQAELERLNSALSALGSLDGVAERRRGPRHMSAGARRRIAAAQRARWEKVRARKQTDSNAPIPIRTTRRRISPAGLARIRAAQRARWAKLKQKKKTA